MAVNLPNPADVWAAQLRQERNRELLEVAARLKCHITVVLTFDGDGKSRPPKITLG